MYFQINKKDPSWSEEPQKRINENLHKITSVPDLNKDRVFSLVFEKHSILVNKEIPQNVVDLFSNRLKEIIDQRNKLLLEGYELMYAFEDVNKESGNIIAKDLPAGHRPKHVTVELDTTHHNMKNNHLHNFLESYKLQGNEKVTKFNVYPSGENYKYFDYKGNEVFLRVEEHDVIRKSDIKIDDIKRIDYIPGKNYWKDGYQVVIYS